MESNPCDCSKLFTSDEVDITLSLRKFQELFHCKTIGKYRTVTS